MAVVPVYRMITLPDSNIYLQTDLYKNMTGRSPIEGEKVTIIISKKECLIIQYYPVFMFMMFKPISNCITSFFPSKAFIYCIINFKTLRAQLIT